jgi:hypothetical protein
MQFGDVIANPAQTAVVAEICVADPFAEEFAEEEIVLDNFAAWDDMFRREAPRVANRRDPGFAALVQSAIEASAPIASERIDPSPLSVVRKQEVEEAATDEDQAAWDDDSKWPPLRLAVVSEPAPLKAIPLLPPSASVDAVAAAWDKMMTTIELNQGADKKASTQSPVLVVEEDGVPGKPNPPVRREAYRNLFSRLRSG